MSPRVRTPGLFIIVAVQPLILVFDVYFAGLFEHPTVPIGVVSWLFRGAMYLAQAVKNSVQIGRTLSCSFEWLFPLTGFRASKSGINCRILSIVAVDAALLLVATRPATVVLGIRITRALGHVITTSQPAVFSRVMLCSICLVHPLFWLMELF